MPNQCQSCETDTCFTILASVRPSDLHTNHINCGCNYHKLISLLSNLFKMNIRFKILI